MLSTKKRAFHTAGTAAVTLLLLSGIAFSSVFAAQHYTPRQLEALESRIGKQYWIDLAAGRKPPFLAVPAPGAAPIDIEANTSFEITELVEGESEHPYYKLRFASGQQGYIRPETFFEELNLSFFSVDPHANEKRKETVAAEEEEKRIAWIQAQPWSMAVKEAAIKKQAVIGMRTHEVRKVIGQPARSSKVRKPQANIEEQWIYADGAVLIFHNGLLSRIESSGKPNR